MEKIYYGNDKEQFLEVYLNNQSNNNWVILVHGGYWRQQYDKSIMNDLVNKLSKKGLNIVNVEYRRGKNEWPIPADDVSKAINVFKESQFYNHDNKIILMGHSVGGQLVLLNETEADYVIALAPVTDVPFTYDKKLGENAAEEYFGNARSLMKKASPIEKNNLTTKTLIIHGKNDDKVLMKTTLDFYNKFNDEDIDLFIFNDLPHMECINGQNPYFKHVIEWIKSKN